jgi:DNA-binding MarR family transcriptional regulator
MTVFRVNGLLLDAADTIAKPSGITSARWQVLGAVLAEPQTVADIARLMGLARQSVQRLADLLVREDFATYQENPAHRRAKLLAITSKGKRVVKSLSARHDAWTEQIRAKVALKDTERANAVLEHLIDVLQPSSC